MPCPGLTLTTVSLLALFCASAGLAENKDVWLHPRCTSLPVERNSWITQMPDGRLATVDNDGLRYSSDDGRTWSDPLPVKIQPGTKPHSLGEGRVLLATRNGVLVVVYMDEQNEKWGWDEAKNLPIPAAKLDVWSARSVDGGKTWVDDTQILNGYCGALIDIKQLASGRIVATIQDMLYDQGRHYIFTSVSDDDGKAWRRGNNIDLGGRGDHDGGIEATFADLSDGRLMLFIRTNLDQFWKAYSTDQGLNWRAMAPSGVDASSSPGHLLRLKSGRLALIWNRLQAEDGTAPPRASGHRSETNASWFRKELSIAFSDDDGKSWTKPVVVARHSNGQLAYPYMLERRPGEVWVIVRAPSGGPVCFSLHEKDFVRREKLKLMKGG